jgi:hypothetical protein
VKSEGESVEWVIVRVGESVEGDSEIVWWCE